MTKDETKAVLVSMLAEDTGRHFLDSGGAYGRNWERNQGRDFEKEPEATLDWSWGSPSVTVSVYHFLSNALVFDREMDTLFYKVFLPRQDDDKSWFELVPMFLEWLENTSPDTLNTNVGKLWQRRKGECVYCHGLDEDVLRLFGHKASGLYGDGKPYTENTYNHESLLSQIIQYTLFNIENEEFIALMIHGGCDARGGYTRPRFFQQTADERLLCDADANIVCPNDHGWYTDDAYHWYPHNEEEHDLKDVVTERKDEMRWAMIKSTREDWLANRQAMRDAIAAGQQGLPDIPLPNPEVGLDTGVVWVDEDGNGYCPICGERLTAYA